MPGLQDWVNKWVRVNKVSVRFPDDEELSEHRHVKVRHVDRHPSVQPAIGAGGGSSSTPSNSTFGNVISSHDGNNTMNDGSTHTSRPNGQQQQVDVVGVGGGGAVGELHQQQQHQQLESSFIQLQHHHQQQDLTAYDDMSNSVTDTFQLSTAYGRYRTNSNNNNNGSPKLLSSRSSGSKLGGLQGRFSKRKESRKRRNSNRTQQQQQQQNDGAASSAVAGQQDDNLNRSLSSSIHSKKSIQRSNHGEKTKLKRTNSQSDLLKVKAVEVKQNPNLLVQQRKYQASYLAQMDALATHRNNANANTGDETLLTDLDASIQPPSGLDVGSNVRRRSPSLLGDSILSSHSLLSSSHPARFVSHASGSRVIINESSTTRSNSPFLYGSAVGIRNTGSSSNNNMLIKQHKNTLRRKSSLGRESIGTTTSSSSAARSGGPGGGTIASVAARMYLNHLASLETVNNGGGGHHGGGSNRLLSLRTSSQRSMSRNNNNGNYHDDEDDNNGAVISKARLSEPMLQNEKDDNINNKFTKKIGRDSKQYISSERYEDGFKKERWKDYSTNKDNDELFVESSNNNDEVRVQARNNSKLQNPSAVGSIDTLPIFDIAPRVTEALRRQESLLEKITEEKVHTEKDNQHQLTNTFYESRGIVEESLLREEDISVLYQEITPVKRTRNHLSKQLQEQSQQHESDGKRQDEITLLKNEIYQQHEIELEEAYEAIRIRDDVIEQLSKRLSMALDLLGESR